MCTVLHVLNASSSQTSFQRKLIAVDHGNGVIVTDTSLQSSTQDREVTLLPCLQTRSSTTFMATRSEKCTLYRVLVHAHQKVEYGHNVHVYVRHACCRQQENGKLTKCSALKLTNEAVTLE